MSRRTIWQSKVLILGSDTDLGLDTAPVELMACIQTAGINRVEFALKFRSGATGGKWQKFFGHEVTGTLAAVRDGTLGSLFEGFRRDGDSEGDGAEGGGPGAFKPAIRVNLFPLIGIELMATGGQISAGALVRSSNVVTGVVKDAAGNAIQHGFYVGQTIKLNSNDSLFGGGDKVITAVPGGDTFSYAEGGADGSSTSTTDASAEYDIRLQRNADGSFSVIVRGNTIVTFYPDSMAMQQGSFFAHSVDPTGYTAHAGGGQTSATQMFNELNLVNTVATTGDSVKMPYCGYGKQVAVFNAGANSVNVYPYDGQGIDSLGTNNPIAIAAGASREFWGFGSLWRSR